MKKLIAAILACVLMFTLAVPALGESCYVFLRNFLTESDNELCHLGAPAKAAPENTGNIVLLIYQAEEQTLMLGGINEYGQNELCIWHNVELLSGIAIFYAVCNNWYAMTDLCASGYVLMLDWMSGEDDSLFISDASEAALFTSAIAELMQ